MYIEKERKFLVYGECLDMENLLQDISTMKYVVQGYFRVADANQVRVSVTDNIKGRINIKGARRYYSRPEFDYTIPVEDARKMVRFCGDQTITKIRIHLKSTKRLVVDVYGDKNYGLIIAEAEFDPNSKSRYIPKRKWLKEDVTSIDRFYNKELVKRPFSKWTDPLEKVILPTNTDDFTEKLKRKLATRFVYINTAVSSIVFENYRQKKTQIPEWEVL